jgi:hypothetical protein
LTPANPSKTTTADSGTLVVLVVGDMTEPRQPGEIGPAGVDFVAPTALAARLTGRAAPALVLSPLSGRGFDAVTIAQTLQAAAYRGVYYATTRALPDPALVRAEVTRVAPDLVFDLLLPDDMAWLMRAARG